MKNTFRRILTSVMAVFLAFAFLTADIQPIVVHATSQANPKPAKKPARTIAKVPKKQTKKQPQPKPQQQQKPLTEAEKKAIVDAELYEWAAERQEDKKKHKETLEKVAQALDVTNQGVELAISIWQDAADGGDFDAASTISGLLDLAGGILNCITPWGAVASAGLNIFKTIFMAAMGGAEAPSEMALMEDRLNQRLDEISNQISEVQDQLSDMSDQINESTEKIISSISTEIEGQSDKDHLRDFMISSGTGDFSYRQLRNYIYGSTTDNPDAMTAYYALLREVQMKPGTSEEIKHYYDLLYSSLVDNRDSFHDYVTGDGFGKSIVQTYYDVLSSRPDLTAEMGMSAELATIQFAYDLYQTEMMMDQLILNCNNYQFIQMALYEQSEYNYGTGTVLYREILNDQKESTIAKSLYVGIDEMRMQFANDLVYVLGVTDSYVIEQNGTFYSHSTSEIDGIVCAQVLENQTIYFNTIPDSAASLFDLDVESFRYVGNGIVDGTGIAVVNSQSTNANISLIYTDTDGSSETLGTIQFQDGTTGTFGGGNGTEAAPYLIATARQFLNIKDDMEACYRLVKDIDLGDVEIDPLGYGLNTADSEVYTEFDGLLDGDGFTLSSLKIAGYTHSGIFGKIGTTGMVQDLNVKEAIVEVNISEAKTSTSTFTGGIIAGTNNGVIYGCTVEDCQVKVSSETDNAGAERTVYLKYGGIAGVNNNQLTLVMAKDTEVDVSSTHDFAGASTSGNKNNVFAGGICGTCPGYINYAYADKDVEVNAYAKSRLSPKTTVNPYVTALAGGITTNQNMDDLENIQNIYSDADKDNITATYKLETYSSGWGKHYKNCENGKSTLINGFSSSELDKVKAEDADTIVDGIKEIPTYTLSIVDATEEYAAGAVELNRDKLTVQVNDKAVESFTLLNLYGFSTYNESYKDQREVEVTAMVLATYNLSEEDEEAQTETRLLRATFPITVGPNQVKEIEIVNYETSYLKGESVDTTAMIEVKDANGKKSTVNDAQLTIPNADTATSKIGTHQMTVSYQGVSTIVEIEVMCNVHFSHYDYDNPEHFTFIQSVAADCQHGGFDEYLCAGCNEVIKTNRTGAVAHKHVRDISEAATCARPGVIGSVYCLYCHEVFEEEVELPRLAHNIVNQNDPNNHFCTQCEKSYAHDYVVSESLVDGVVTYTYTCYSCGYVGQKNDTNIITNEERLRPAVVVSDGFTTEPGGLVTLYVDLENNPGVNGANFGIRYDERLELVEWREGEFFSGTSTEASHSVSCGYNFVWGNEASYNNQGGNLLELVFRLPEDATKQDSYEVAVVYSVVAGSEGGFALPNSVCATLGVPSNHPQKFKTKDGVIRLVDRLPGDVDNTTSVNMRDALYLSYCLVDEEHYPITKEVKQYGDVNLDTMVTVNDVVKVLQSISGGYGASLLSPEYRIQLNTNGYTYQPDALFVHLYGANNTYAALSLIEQEMEKREGYKFMGWYTRLEGGTKIDAANYETTLVSYDQDQKIQTLYAHWQKNSVSFDMNGATSEWLDKETYLGGGEQWITLTAPVEEYTVAFVDPNNTNNRKTEKLSRKFAYWLGSDGVKYYAGDQLNVSKLNMGELTLTAQWEEWELNFPALEKPGYDATQITWYTNQHLTDKLEGNVHEVIKAMTTRVLYADWTAPNTYYVAYDGNGATSGTMSNSAHVYDFASQLSNNAFVRKYNVTFNYGWSGQSNASLTKTHNFKFWSRDGVNAVADNMANNWTTEPGKVITVYAVWDTQTVELPMPNARTGYSFQGWYLDAAYTYLAGATGQAYSTYETTDECTLYAKWTPNNYSVVYELNTMGTGGAAAGNSDQCYTTPTWKTTGNPDYITYDKTGTYLDVPTAPHYNFVGWFTAPVGGTQIADSTGKVLVANAFAQSNTQLYAHWTQAYSGTYIYDEASLRAIGSSGTYHIVKDITLTGDWTPKDSFSGVLDGHGHIISDVKYTTRTDGTNTVVRYGFFRSLSGTVQNLTFRNLEMTIVKSKDGQKDVYVGGVAGVFDGTLDNVHLVDSSVYNEHYRDVVTSGDYVNTHTGGLVGAMMAGTIKNCSMTGTGLVYSCSKFATKSADAQAFAGGIVGTMAAGNVTYCTRGDGIKVTAHSEVDSSKSAYRSAAGGIIGNRGGGSYSNLTSTANNLFATYDRDDYANSSWARKGQYVGNGA